MAAAAETDAGTSLAGKVARLRERLTGSRQTAFAVVQVSEEQEALQRVAALQGTTDGIFLVNHGIGHQRLLRICERVVHAHPTVPVGVACLDLRPQDVFCRLPAGVAAVWAPQIVPWPPEPEALAAVDSARREAGWPGLYFCGIPPVACRGPRPALQAPLQAAIEHVDVVTLGDLAAQQPPKLRLVRRARQTVGRRPLVIVGCFTSETAAPLLAYVDGVMAVAGSASGAAILPGARGPDAPPAEECAEGLRAAARGAPGPGRKSPACSATAFSAERTHAYG